MNGCKSDGIQIRSRLGWIFVLLLVSGSALAQTTGDYRTDQGGGNWNSPTSWEVFVSGAWQKLENVSAGVYQNITPTSASGNIGILNNISVTASVAVDQVTINSGITLTISAGQTLTINDGPGDDLINSGTITVTGSLSVSAGGTYSHNQNGGTVPLVSWGANSTCYVTGVTNGTVTLNSSNSFQNFIWDCPSQSGISNLGGNLRTINGSLSILSTNGNILRLTANSVFTLNITGDFSITGNSVVTFGTTANPVVINLSGDFDYSSTATSVFKTSGVYTFNVGGLFSQSSGIIDMSSGNNGATINLSGDFSQSAGATITESGGGTGAFNFIGTSGAQNISSLGTISQTVNFSISNSNGISLNTNLSAPSNFIQSGGSGNVNLNGHSLTVNGNYSQINGAIGINSASSLILQGTGVLPASLSFSGTDLFNLTINQTGTLTTSGSFQLTNLNLLNGTLTPTGITLASGGTVTRSSGSISTTPSGTSYNLIYNNSVNINSGPELPSSSTVLNNLTQQGVGITSIIQALTTINGNLTLSGGTLDLGGNSLTLLGNLISNAALTASAGSTFTFVGASSTLSGSAAPSFNTLSITGNLTPSTSYQVNGNYTVANGAVVNAGSGTVSFGGTTVITNNGTMNLNAVTILASSTLTAPANSVGIAGNLLINNTSVFNNGGGTIVFNGTTVISGGGTKTFNNVTVTGSVSAAGTVTWGINGTLANAGTVNFSTSTGVTTFGGTTPSISGSGSTSFGPITISTGATLSSASNFSINGALVGTGNFLFTGTVTFNGSTTMSGAGSKSFNNITVNNGSTFNPQVSFSVSGNIVVNGTIADPNNTHTTTFTGNSILSGSPTSCVFDAIIINNGASLTLNSNVTIDNSLTVSGSITSSATVTFTALTMTGTGSIVFNNVTVGTGAFIPNANYSIAGSMIINGTLNAGNATTTFNGTTVLSGAGGGTFNNINITGTLTSRLSTEPLITINGTFTNAGTFNGSSGTISLGGSLVNNGIFNGGSGTFNFNTVNSATRTITGTSSITFNNLGIFDKGQATDVSNQLTAPASVNLSGALSFGEAAAVLDADGSGTSLFRLLSTSDNTATDARIAPITFANANITGSFTVQRFVSSENRIYRYIASPLVGATVSQLKAAIPITGNFADPSDANSTPPCSGCGTNSSLFYFDESTNAYVSYPLSGQSSAATTFTNGRGYSAFFRHSGTGAVGQVTINFTGTNPSTAGVSLPVSPNALGYSLVGNPYPSPIVWGATGWTRTNISDVIVVRDNATGNHQSHGTADNFIIAPGQSFWVQSTATGAALTITETAKATSGSYSFYRTEQPIIDEMELLLRKSSTGFTDKARIRIIEGSSSAFDSYDGMDKSFGDFNNSLAQDISTLTSDLKAMGINSIPSITCGQTFNLSISDYLNSGETTASYTLQINPDGIFKSISWELRDNYTSSSFNLSNGGTYTFSVDANIAGSKAADRFYLIATQSISIDPTKAISVSNSVCSNEDALIALETQKDFAYGIEINGVYRHNVAIGDGSTNAITIPVAWLSDGNNQIKVKANTGCDSQFLSTVLSVNKNNSASIPSVVSASACKVASVTLKASSATTSDTFKWYSTPEGGAALASGSQFVTPVLSDTTTYYVSAVSSEGCEGPRASVKAEVFDLSKQITVIPASSVCTGEKMTLQVNSDFISGTYKWYSDKQSPTPIGIGAQYVVSSLASTSTYYVSLATDSGCEGSRVEVLANVNSFDPSLSYRFEKTSVCSGSNQVLYAAGAPENSRYEWYASATDKEPIAFGKTFTTNALSATTDFYLMARNQENCTSSRIKVPVMVESLQGAPSLSYSISKICSREESQISLGGLQKDYTYRWYSQASGGLSIHSGAQYILSGLDEKTSVFVSSVDAKGCESKLRQQIEVDPVKLPAVLIDASRTGILKSNYPTGNQWYLNSIELPGQTKQEIIPTETGSYSTRVDINGCSQWSFAVEVVNLVSSIKEFNRTIYIYPNPSVEELRVKAEGDEQLACSLFDERGSLAAIISMHRSGNGWEGELDVRNLSKGMYFVRITSENKSVSTHKVIIK